MPKLGTIKLRKGIVGNLHPSLSFLDTEDIPFQGWYNRDLHFFFIEFGHINNDRYEKAVIGANVEIVADVIRKWKKQEK